MPIPTDHMIAVIPNVPKNTTGESPYKFVARCSCGWEALSLSQEIATYFANKHAGVQQFRGNNVTLTTEVEKKDSGVRAS